MRTVFLAATFAAHLGGALPVAPTPTPRPSESPAAAEDVVHLRNGDRISGRLLSETPRLVRLQTAFGRLNIPRARVARIVHADGREEPAAAPAPASPSPSGEAALALTITGKTFWHAWDRKQVPETPALRLQVETDDAIVAAYVDGRTDPEEIGGASVNTFSFPDVVVESADGARAEPPAVTAGRIELRIVLPASAAGARRVRVSYQVAGPDGAWHRLVTEEVPAELVAGRETPIEVRQDLGRMEYSRRQMRNVDTFRLALTAAPPRPRAGPPAA